MSINYLLPKNIDELLNRFEELQSDIFDRLNLVSEKIGTLRDPYLVPKEFLKPLAKDLQTYFLFTADTEEEKREVIAHSLYLHRIKGTKKAIELALEANGFPAKIEEWWEYDGEPYFFKATLEIPADTSIRYDSKILNKLISLINHFKNVRSWLDELLLQLPPAECDFRVGGGLVLEPKIKSEIEFEGESRENLFGGLVVGAKLANDLVVNVKGDTKVGGGLVCDMKMGSDLIMNAQSNFAIGGAMVWTI